MDLYKIPNDIIINSQSIALSIYQYDLMLNPDLVFFKEKYIQDTVYTLRFLSISLEMGEPLIFSNFMIWFGELSYYLRFSLESMENHFNACTHVFKNTMEESIYHQLIETYTSGVDHYKKAFLAAKPYDVKVDEFLNDLIEMNSQKAYEYVLKKIDEGMSLKDVYLNLLQPTLYQVGDLWQQRIISVAKEHYITAAIQHIIGKLYPKLFNEKIHLNHAMTAVCPGDELHEIGMRMVADFFELSGWDTQFLGSNIPIKLIVEHLIENPTQILAISATTSAQLREVKSLIDTVKEHKKLNPLKIIVGGKVFNDTPDLWKCIGADGYAFDPEQAVQLATLLIGETYVQS